MTENMLKVLSLVRLSSAGPLLGLCSLAEHFYSHRECIRILPRMLPPCSSHHKLLCVDIADELLPSTGSRVCITDYASVPGEDAPLT